MSTPLAIGVIAALAAAAELSRRGSRSETEIQARIVELVRARRMDEARALSESLGEERLYLTGADLSGANLEGLNLYADLEQADLSGANLTNADLNGSYLDSANLDGASLVQADLSGVDLQGASLTGADLSFAILYDTDLTDANLTDAILTGAYLKGATGIDLGPDRVFKGIPNGYRVQRSRLSSRDYGLVESD